MDESDLVNYLLGNFIYGRGPENIFFPENGKFSILLKNSLAVHSELIRWRKLEKNKDPSIVILHGASFDLSDEITLDFAFEAATLEHFIGSCQVKISRLGPNRIIVELFNVTSYTSANVYKEIFRWKKYPPSTVRSPYKCEKQKTYSNISQYFSFTMTQKELDDLRVNKNDKKR